MIFAAIFLSAICTFGLRAMPFLVFHGEHKMPAWLEQLGKRLPPAIMAVLIVYCLKDVLTDVTGLLIPKLAGVFVVAGSYKWKHNTLVSIVAGTVVYMVLLRL